MNKITMITFLLVSSICCAERNPFLMDDKTPLASTHKTTYLQLHYNSGTNLLKIIKSMKQNLISSSGTIVYSPHCRTLVINDTPSHTRKVISLVHHLDSPTPEVLIKAQIINLDRDYLKKIGIDFDSTTKPIENENSVPVFNFIKHFKTHININFLEQHGHANVIASPLLFTLNNEPSVIESGSEIPYQQLTKSGGTSVTFKKASLRLDITPTVLPQNRILLKIKINQDSISNLSVNGEPAIKTQNMKTEVIANNKTTVVLGGILSTSRNISINGIPIISKLPIVGSLFTNRHTSHHDKELLLLITPTIKKIT